MNEKPILFSAPMIQAIIDGRKSMTRRVVKMAGVDFRGAGGRDGEDWDNPSCWGFEDEDGREWALALGDLVDKVISSPHGRVGDGLWVRETWRVVAWDYDGPAVTVQYRAGGASNINIPSQFADAATNWLEQYSAKLETLPGVHVEDGPTYDGHLSFDNVDVIPWKPSIFMPRWASRITLEITGVRCERLQDITEEDAEAEGAMHHAGGGIGHSGWKHDYHDVFASARASFCWLWDSLNAKRGFGWDTNPWVWVVKFMRVDR